jgi:uncharacterized repeat protein (TIGR01451 family)
VHSSGGTTLTAADSTIAGNNGTLNGNPAPTSGQISGAASFNGGNSITGVSTLSGLQNATISLWVKQNSSGGSPYGAWVATTAGYQTGYFVGRDAATNSWQAYMNGLKLSGTGLAYNTWQHITLTYASGVSGGFKIYLNGVQNASSTQTGAITAHTTYDFGTDGTYASQSALDEVHMSNTVRSADWIRTEYNNQSSAATFYSLGASQSGPGGGAADLTISKSHTGNFTQGQTGATYTITVSNIGAGATSGTVNVSDSLPTGLTATSIAGTGWTCTAPGGPCWRSDALAGGGSYPPITLTVNVAANAPGSVTNTVSVSGGGDTNGANNTANDPTTIGGPDLTITKTHTGNFTQGQTGATFTISVSNVGTGPTNGTVSVMDSPQTGLTATAISGTGWNCTQPSGPCTRSDALAAGASYPALTSTANVASDAPATVVNTATVSGGGDGNSGNNTDDDSATVQGAPPVVTNVSIVPYSGAGPVDVIQSFTATYRDTAGYGDINMLEMWIDSSPTSPNDAWSCKIMWFASTNTVYLLTDDAIWYRDVPPDRSNTQCKVYGAGTSVSGSGNQMTMTVSVSFNAAYVGQKYTYMRATGSSTSPLQQMGAWYVWSPGGTDLAIFKTHNGNFTQGQIGATYTINVTNVGTVATGGTVTVTDSLPAGLTATAITGTGWSCPQQPGGPCTRSDVLVPGLYYPPLNVSVNVASNAPSSVTNTATVSVAGDSNLANNTFNDPTTILAGGAPDLRITKTHSGNFTQGQTGATYTIRVNNEGTVATSGTVTVTDSLPAGLTGAGMSGTGWTCPGMSGPCTRSDALAPGAYYPPVTLTVNVASNASSPLTNTATVSVAGDTNAANNTSNDQTTINSGGAPDLSITATSRRVRPVRLTR